MFVLKYGLYILLMFDGRAVLMRSPTEGIATTTVIQDLSQGDQIKRASTDKSGPFDLKELFTHQ